MAQDQSGNKTEIPRRPHEAKVFEKIFRSLGTTPISRKRSRSEKAILGALGEFRGIFGEALGAQKPILGMRNPILGMASQT